LNTIRNEKAIKRKLQSSAQREKYLKKKELTEASKEESEKKRMKEFYKAEGKRKVYESNAKSRKKPKTSE